MSCVIMRITKRPEGGSLGSCCNTSSECPVQATPVDPPARFESVCTIDISVADAELA